MRLSSGARYVGASLFAGGTILIILAIEGMLPHGSNSVYTSDMFTQLVVNIGMLLMATVMVAFGMFLALYSGNRSSAEMNGEDND
jgi:hypothetical protein